MATCGRCGCKDIAGGSWVPDICRRCGAIDSPSGWYYDPDNASRFNPDKYDEEHKVDDTIFDDAIKERNKKMFEDIHKTLNTAVKPVKPENEDLYEKETYSLVTLTRHKVRLKINLKCSDFKKILENVPDDAVLTNVEIEDDLSYVTELYFDVETVY